MKTAKFDTPRAVIYTRVSTDEQVDNTSLDGQVIACRERAAALGAVIVGEHSDPGISGGRYMTRPGIQAALEDLESGKADTLIIAKLDRCSRDREHQSAIKKRVETAGARLVFCDMTFEDTPEGDLAFGIMGSFAEYERRVIRHRTMKGKRRAAENGRQPSRVQSPYGYHVVTRQDVLTGLYPVGTDGTYQVIEEQAQWIRQAFIRYAAGDSLRTVCRWLQESGVPTARGGAYWKPKILARMLRNPVYKGQGRFGHVEVVSDESMLQRGYKRSYFTRDAPAEKRVTIEAPPVIDEHTWNLCQERLATNQATCSGNPRRKYMLTGLLRCPRCRRRMAATYKSRRNPATSGHSYSCNDSRPSCNPAGHVCHSVNYNGKQADSLIIKAIAEAAHHSDRIADALTAHQLHRQAADGTVPEKERARLQGELERLQEQEKATVKAQIAGIRAVANPVIYAGLLSEIADQRGAIERRLQQLQQAAQARPRQDAQGEAAIIADVLGAVDEVLSAPDTEVTTAEKQALLVRWVERIYPVLTDDGPGYAIELKPAREETVTMISVTAPPAQGHANAAIIELLSKSLGLPKSTLCIVRGQKSREKLVRLSGVAVVDARSRLAALL